MRSTQISGKQRASPKVNQIVLHGRKSHNYPGEQVVQDSLHTRIIIVKVASLMSGFTPRDTEVGLKYRALFITYLFTARRNSEILQLRFRDIERVTINENGQRREIYQYYFYGKGSKMIRDAAELPGPAADAIFSYLEQSGRLKTIQPDDAIFTTDTDYIGRGGYDPKRPLAPQTVWKTAKRYAIAAGLDEDMVSIHMWRHISARTRFDQGEDIRSIQNLLRHASLQTTSVYLSEMTTVVDKGALLLGARFANL